MLVPDNDPETGVERTRDVCQKQDPIAEEEGRAGIGMGWMEGAGKHSQLQQPSTASFCTFEQPVAALDCIFLRLEAGLAGAPSLGKAGEPASPAWLLLHAMY